MEAFILIGAVLITVLLIIAYKIKSRQLLRRKSHIINFAIPAKVLQTVKSRYPHLTDSQLNTVESGLREWFHINLMAKGRAVSMPSQVIDVAWHELILFTKFYEEFCQKAFGRFLHHHPAEAMSSPHAAQQGIKTAWQLACEKEQISSIKPARLPLIFAIDALLEIEDGFKYALNCRTDSKDNYCATHISCSSVSCGSATNSNSGGDTSAGGDSGGGGCSGGGCGGGS